MRVKLVGYVLMSSLAVSQVRGETRSEVPKRSCREERFQTVEEAEEAYQAGCRLVIEFYRALRSDLPASELPDLFPQEMFPPTGSPAKWREEVWGFLRQRAEVFRLSRHQWLGTNEIREIRQLGIVSAVVFNPRRGERFWQGAMHIELLGSIPVPPRRSPDGGFIPHGMHKTIRFPIFKFAEGYKIYAPSIMVNGVYLDWPDFLAGDSFVWYPTNVLEALGFPKSIGDCRWNINRAMELK